MWAHLDSRSPVESRFCRPTAGAGNGMGPLDWHFFRRRIEGLRSGLAVLALTVPFLVAAGEVPWEAGPGYRSAVLAVPEHGRDGFVRVPGSLSGILFTNVLSTESGIRSQLRLAGSGV